MYGLEHFHNESTLYCYKAREISVGGQSPPTEISSAICFKGEML